MLCSLNSTRCEVVRRLTDDMTRFQWNPRFRLLPAGTAKSTTRLSVIRPGVKGSHIGTGKEGGPLNNYNQWLRRKHQTWR